MSTTSDRPPTGAATIALQEPVVDQAVRDPALVAALAGLVAVGEVAGDRREVGAAGDLVLELVHLVLVGLGVHDLDDVPAEVGLERLEDLARLQARLQDGVLELLDEVRAAVDPAQLAAGAGVALGGRLVALVAGELVELRGVLDEVVVGRFRGQLGDAPRGVVGRQVLGLAGIVVRREEDVADLDRVPAAAASRAPAGRARGCGAACLTPSRRRPPCRRAPGG